MSGETAETTSDDASIETALADVVTEETPNETPADDKPAAETTETTTDEVDVDVAPAETDDKSDKDVNVDVTEEAKSEEGDKSDEDQETAEADEEEKSSNAPEKYEAFNLPEGYTISDEAHEAFSALARDMDLSQENAQKLVDMHIEMRSQLAKDQIAKDEQRKADQQKANKEALAADEDVGGANLEQSIGLARSVLTKLGSPDLNAALREAGLNTHPAFVKFAVAVGKHLGEDTFVQASAKPVAKKFEAIDLYPSMQQG